MSTSFTKRRRTGSKTKVPRILEGKKVFDGRRVLYKGDYHRLEFVPSPSQHIRVHDRIIVLPNYANINLRQVLKDWMRKETEKVVEKSDTRKWAYRIRDKRIVFNPQLIALPVELADYVILRELTRLMEFGQSKKFTNDLGLIVPDFRVKELSLKRYSIE